MNGELLHMTMVAAYGNHYLSQNEKKIVFPYNERFIGKVNFIITYSNSGFVQKLFGKGNRLIAESVEDWFRYLKSENCIGLELLLNNSNKENHIISAYANDVFGWSIICKYHNYTEFWARKWESDNNGDKTQWNIYYCGSKLHIDNRAQNDINLNGLKTRLDSILESVGDFAVEIGFEGWKEYFDRGREALKAESVNEEKPFPESYSVEAKQLILAVAQSWVFGGMGSWNDSPPYYAHEQGRGEEYDSLTQELYSTMIECI